MLRKEIIVATRSSKLAYTQTIQTVQQLKRYHPDIHFSIKKISTKGDRETKRSLTTFGDTGIFVKELEQALLAGEADMAIHSLKDMPANLSKDLQLAAFPKRADVRDILLRKKPFSDKNTVIGTGSPRRILQLALKYQNADFKLIRGNIDTRIRKLDKGKYDAITVAVAGLDRLNIKYDKKHILSTKVCLPAVGQGALVIQCRKKDDEIHDVVKEINHEPTEKAILSERIFLHQMQGGCKFPLAAYAYCENNSIILEALAGDLKSKRFIRNKVKFDQKNTKSKVIEFSKIIKKGCLEKGISLNF